MIVRLFQDEESWVEAALDEFRSVLGIVQKERRNNASLCLSGGSSPETIYCAMAALPVDGVQFDLWPGDERAVPDGDPARNGGMIARAFSACRWKPHPRIRLWPDTPKVDDASKAALRYQDELREAFGGKPVFDLLFLGLGSDGHTASLFPGGAESESFINTEKMTAVTASPVPPLTRMTLLPGALQSARRTVFLVKGSDKLAVVKKLESRDPSIPATRFTNPGTTVLYLT